MAFEAKYWGACANECGSLIAVGDRVVYNADDELVHEDCAPRPERPAPVCSRCFLTKPCECDER